ncbi:unnamed protein product [Nyctereutes procyonoides]|uniref:(raccoon dog) hypothetical protein n=1 Tax=Nyctereutes procyonoides TaxID=34880 RepID=A0A811YD95_NYCPR|nr:unnamed protein product [Nyctereutes procyonoides]
MPKVAWRLREHDTNPCLDENNYHRERYSTYFLNYKTLKSSMPTAGERDEILGGNGKDDLLTALKLFI